MVEFISILGLTIGTGALFFGGLLILIGLGLFFANPLVGGIVLGAGFFWLIGAGVVGASSFISILFSLFGKDYTYAFWIIGLVIISFFIIKMLVGSRRVSG